MAHQVTLAIIVLTECKLLQDFVLVLAQFSKALQLNDALHAVEQLLVRRKVNFA